MPGKKPKQPKLTIAQIAGALRRCNGIVTKTAEMLGVTQSAITQRIQKSKELQAVQNEVIDKILDAAENVLHRKISKEENLTASIFYLKCKGKQRGYSEKQDVELSGKVNLAHDEWIKEMEKLESETAS